MSKVTSTAVAIGLTLALGTGAAWAQVTQTYTLDGEFDLGTAVSVNHTIVHDQLQLDQVSQSDPFAYIALPSEGDLLKVDSSTGKQVARYPAVYVASCPTCPKANNACDYNGYCGDWDPSRTAVDADGNVWVANRAFGGNNGAEPNRGQGSVTKIGNTTAGTCVDRNGNGVIDTSRDANGDGIVNKLDAAEYLGQNDECLIKSIAVGTRFAVLRALAIDNDGSLWVGGFNTHRAYHINPTDGSQIEDFDLGTTPYGFVIRGDYLYSAGLGNPAVRLNKLTGAVKHLQASCNYGITVDQNNKVWTGRYCGGISRCDFDATPEGGACTDFGGDGHNGVTVDPDGDIWAAGSGRVQKYSSAGVLLGSVAVPGSPYGIAIANDGSVFSAGNLGTATVARGPAHGAPGLVNVTGGIAYPGITYEWAYTYSDMTGFIARNVQKQTGRWNVVYDGGSADLLWTKVAWNNEPQGFSNTTDATLVTQIRSANAQADLGAQPFTVVSSGDDLTALGIKGRFVEITVAFAKTPAAPQGPVLSDLTVTGRSANRPPVAKCANRNACTDAGICTASKGVDVNDGSFDPDGDLLSFNYTPPAPYSLGLSTVKLDVAATGGADSCTASVMVTDCENPVITCPAPVTVECSQGNGCQTMTPATATASDNCSISSTTNAAAACFPRGTTATHYSTADGSGNTASCDSSITVQDTTPPVITSTGAGSLWPPNHKLITIGLDQCGIVAKDACDGAETSAGGNGATITCVTSDELPNSLGDGNTETDIVIVDATHVQVRQERSGKLDGRVYKIGFRIVDDAGNASDGVCQITVPHDQGPKGAAVDSGVKYTVCK